MKLISVFLYYGEAEMLKFRMDILSPLVDVFVPVENSFTHQGEPRAWSLEGVRSDNLRPYFGHYYSPEKLYHIEGPQRDFFLDATKEFSDDDLVLVSDCDEIPSPEAVSFVRQHPQILPKLIRLKHFNLKLNYFKPKEPKTCCFSTLKIMRSLGGQKQKDIMETYAELLIDPPGWHLSYFGGTDAVLRKLKCYSEAQFNTPEIANKPHIERCIAAGIHPLNTSISYDVVAPNFFPQYFIDFAPKDWWI